MTAAKTIIALICLAVCFALALIGYKSYQHHLVQVRCEELVNEAMRKVDAVAEARALEFAQYIEKQQGGAKPFSEELVSMRGSVAAVECHLPGAATDCFQRYVEQKFGEHLFAPSAVGEAMVRALDGGAKDVDAIENRLAVDLKQELVGSTVRFDPQMLVAAQFDGAANRLRAASNQDLTRTAAGLVVAELGTYLGTQILIRLGVSTGLVTIGFANSWWTVGASLILGLALNEIWTHITQPGPTIEAELRGVLTTMANSGRSTIRTELGKVASARKASWQQAMKGTAS